jgi:hypothetical protein
MVRGSQVRFQSTKSTLLVFPLFLPWSVRLLVRRPVLVFRTRKLESALRPSPARKKTPALDSSSPLDSESRSKFIYLINL